MAQAIAKWLIFRVAVGLFPLVFGFGFLLVLDPAWQANSATLLLGGQLLLIGGALCGGSIGELLSSPLRHPVARLVCGGISLFVWVGGAAFYGAILTASQVKHPVNADFVFWGSIGFYAFGILSAFNCLLIAESARRNGATA